MEISVWALSGAHGAAGGRPGPHRHHRPCRGPPTVLPRGGTLPGGGAGRRAFLLASGPLTLCQIASGLLGARDGSIPHVEWGSLRERPSRCHALCGGMGTAHSECASAGLVCFQTAPQTEQLSVPPGCQGNEINRSAAQMLDALAKLAMRVASQSPILRASKLVWGGGCSFPRCNGPNRAAPACGRSTD